MRDLRKDLETCNQATPGPWRCLDDTPVDPEWARIFPQDLDFVMGSREGWPHAIERAIKAEAEVERLTDLLDHYNAKCAICDCSDDVTVLQAENAKLRKVVEAAKDHLNTDVGSRAFKQTDIALRYALAEPDKGVTPK